MKKQTWIVGLMAALTVMLAAVGSLCGAVYSEAINPALYGEKSARRLRRRMACATTTL